MLKISVNRVSFLKGIQNVEKAVTDNKIRPVISGIYLEAKGRMIFLRGTDLEMTINSLIDGEVIQEGTIVFSYQTVYEYLKEIKEENITIVEDEGKIVIESNNASSEFSVYDAGSPFSGFLPS